MEFLICHWLCAMPASAVRRALPLSQDASLAEHSACRLTLHITLPFGPRDSLRFDGLWYSLYNMGPPQLFFEITVTIEKFNNDTGAYELVWTVHRFPAAPPIINSDVATTIIIAL
jgi:hypothetical protein